MEDKEIIGLYMSRSTKAVSETAAKYGKYCWTIAHNILGDEGETEECVNDTFLRVWKAIPPAVPILFKSIYREDNKKSGTEYV